MADQPQPVAPVPATRENPLPTRTVFSWTELAHLINGTILTIASVGGIAALYGGTLNVKPVAPAPAPVVIPSPPATQDDLAKALAPIVSRLDSLEKKFSDATK